MELITPDNIKSGATLELSINKNMSFNFANDSF